MNGKFSHGQVLEVQRTRSRIRCGRVPPFFQKSLRETWSVNSLKDSGPFPLHSCRKQQRLHFFKPTLRAKDVNSVYRGIFNHATERSILDTEQTIIPSKIESSIQIMALISMFAQGKHSTLLKFVTIILCIYHN